MFKILLLTYAINLGSYGFQPTISQIELETNYRNLQTCEDVAKSINREFKDGSVKIVEYARCIQIYKK